MKRIVTMTLIAVIGLAAYGCNKIEKINAAATNAQCDTSTCGSTCPMTTAKADACCGSAACADKKASKCGEDCTKPCCAKKAKAKPAAAGDAKSCCASKKAAVKPAATSSKNKVDCNPSDCGTWKKDSDSGCPFSGK